MHKAQLGDDIRTSREGIELIKAHERLRLDAYTNAARVKINMLETEIKLLKEELTEQEKKTTR